MGIRNWLVSRRRGILTRRPKSKKSGVNRRLELTEDQERKVKKVLKSLLLPDSDIEAVKRETAVPAREGISIGEFLDSLNIQQRKKFRELWHKRSPRH